jgi:hypothetical protein
MRGRSAACRGLSGRPSAAPPYPSRSPWSALLRAILKSSSSWWNVASAAPPSALTTMSRPPRISMRSNAALSLRLSLFLVTALPTAPGTVIPTRVPGPAEGARATDTVSPSRRALDPLSRTRRKSSLLVKDRTAPTAMVTESPRSGGQPRAPLGPAVLQNRTPGTRLHPGSESMLSLAAARVGLEGALGHENPVRSARPRLLASSKSTSRNPGAPGDARGV